MAFNNKNGTNHFRGMYRNQNLIEYSFYDDTLISYILVQEIIILSILLSSI